MEEKQPVRKLPKLEFLNDARLKLWLIAEIYGWAVTLVGFGFFGMLFVAAVAHLLNVGFSVEALFSLVQLVEGIAIGGGLIAFGTTLRRFIVVQVTFGVILLLIVLWFLYFFSFYGTLENVRQALLFGGVAILPLAICIYANRERLKVKREISIRAAENTFCEFGRKMPADVYMEIIRLGEVGDRFFKNGNYQKAVEKYEAALKIVPEPRAEHDATPWIQAAIGDSYFSAGNYKASADAFRRALNHRKASASPFVQMRLGQSFLELGDSQRAASALETAYNAGGIYIFHGENPKYLRFLRGAVSPTANDGNASPAKEPIR